MEGPYFEKNWESHWRFFNREAAQSDIPLISVTLDAMSIDFKSEREVGRPIRWLFKGALVRDKEVLGWKVESGKEVRTIVGVEWRESMSFSELTRQGGVEAGRSGNGQAVNG